MSQTYYEVLEIPKSATSEQIRKAYLDLVKVWHPDRFIHDLNLHARAQEKLKAVNEAYSILSNSAKRRDYDAQLGRMSPQSQNRPSPTPAASSQSQPPNIRVSVSSLDFGSITQGQIKSLSFTITNTGGPVKGYQIGWAGSPDWVDANVVETPITTFPIKVILTLSPKAVVGNH